MYLFNPGKHGRGGDYIYVFTHIFLSFFLLQYMKKASRITNNILIIILKWSGAGGYGWPIPPLSRHFLYFCVHTQLQYVYNRITVRLGPRNSKNKVSVHSWQIYSTPSIYIIHKVYLPPFWNNWRISVSHVCWIRLCNIHILRLNFC